MYDGGSPTILAIDDEPYVLNVILQLFQDKYKIIPFKSALGAMKFLESKKADLILLDVEMAEMNGYEVLRRLKGNVKTCGIPVIMLTAALDLENEVMALKNGASDYILKPIRPEILSVRINLQLELEGYRKNLEKLVKKQTREITAAYTDIKEREEITLDLLALVTDIRDKGTGNHILRTSKYVEILVRKLVELRKPGYELTVAESEDYARSSKLHDLGKVGISDTILLKKGKLTVEEFELMKKHTTYGAALLDPAVDKLGKTSFLNTARTIALTHQEKWDGTGYPQGLKGEEIPLCGRIMAVADVYDALISQRPYKEAFSHQRALEIIKEERGTHFDPFLTDIFLEVNEEFAEISSKYR